MNYLIDKYLVCINEQIFIDDLPCIKQEEHDGDMKNQVFDFMGISSSELGEWVTWGHCLFSFSFWGGSP